MQSCSWESRGRRWPNRGETERLFQRALLLSASQCIGGWSRSLTLGFLPGPGHARAAVLTFSPHFTEFIARWVSPLAAPSPCCWALASPNTAPPPSPIPTRGFYSSFVVNRHPHSTYSSTKTHHQLILVFNSIKAWLGPNVVGLNVLIIGIRFKPTYY